VLKNRIFILGAIILLITIFKYAMEKYPFSFTEASVLGQVALLKDTILFVKIWREGNLIIVGVKTIDFFTPKVLHLDKTNE
jgi:hypothetical protein